LAFLLLWYILDNMALMRMDMSNTFESICYLHTLTE